MSADAHVASRLYAARACRDFGDGFVAVLLPVYLLSLGLDPFAIGVVATLALTGSALTTLSIGVWGSRFDPRTLLIGASTLMVATGSAFAASTSLWTVALIAFIGTINPTAGSLSIFVPLEHAVLARVASDADRTHVFARYSLFGVIAAALGSLASGSPDVLAAVGVSRLVALKGMFLFYAALGVAAGLFYRYVPPRSAALEGAPPAALGPSRKTVYKLAALFSIDSFAGGFAVQSLAALWLFHKFGLSLAMAGVFFFWTGVLSALSFPVAVWLSRRLGLINTMVFTHIPSSICLMLAAVAPSLPLALGLLLVRAALSQMDVPTRSSYVMAVVTPPERTAAASFTSLPRSLASAASPSLAGALFAGGFDAWPFVICGGLKIVYDFALLWTFRHVKPPEEA